MDTMDTNGHEWTRIKLEKGIMMSPACLAKSFHGKDFQKQDFAWQFKARETLRSDGNGFIEQ
jgi:hypothetical protein